MNTTTLQKTKHKILDDAHSNNIIISDMNLGNKFKEFERTRLRESEVLLEEIKLRPKYYRKYKTGSIVKVHFGVNAGSEFSGDHFAIVISKNDTTLNPILHVIPISSKKHKSSLEIEDEVKKLKKIYNNTLNKNEKKKIKKCLNYYSKCNNINSYAMIEHMRTISKLSIINPINKYDYIRKIKISNKQLEKITEAIKKEYT